MTGGVSTNAYVINYTTELTTNGGDFYPVLTGSVGQAVFEFLFPTNAAAFFTAEPAPNTPPQVATPAFTPGGGSYGTPTNVLVTCATPGAAIYFTTNGATPTTSDAFIANGGSVLLASSVTLKARAFRLGYVNSDVASATYTINAAPHVFAGTQQVIFADATTLQGVVSDDGLPVSVTVTSTWSQVSGPGTASFANVNLTNSGVSFDNEGIYVLQLVATDSQYSRTSQVTVAWNPTISVALVTPTNGFSGTVPTNLALQATASCTSGSITQMAFYAGSVLIGVSESLTYDFDWRNVPAGTHQLTAVARTDDAANAALASAPVTITVNWPTNVGQLNFTATDLQIPVAGFPLAVTRVHDTRLNTNGSFGFNARLEHEAARLTLPGSFYDGWFGSQSGIGYCIEDTQARLITVTLREGETYYFVPQIVFLSGGEPCVASFVRPTLYNDYEVRLVCVPLGLGQLTVAEPSEPVGMDDQLSGWEEPLTVSFYDEFLFPTSGYDPQPGEFTFTAPDGTQYQFNDDGSLLRRIDRNGNQITDGSTAITYSHPNVSGSTKTITLARDGSGRITNVFDAVSPSPGGPAALRYAYDGSGNLTNVARLIQRSPAVYEGTTYRYTNASYPHHLTHVVDARGVTVQHNVYDASGRLTQQFDALTKATTYTYDFNARRHTVTDRNGQVTLQNFSDSGPIASIVNPLGHVVAFEYDERGRRVREINELGHAITYRYDGDDNVTVVTNRLGHATTNSYNEFRQVLTSVDALGRGITNGYDAKGNLIAMTNALGVVTRYGYDAQGNRTRQTNAFGLPEQTSITNRYDAFGNLTNVVDALGGSFRYRYDANGNQTNFVDALNRTNRYAYDAANRRVLSVFADGTSQGIAHAQDNQHLAETNEAGIVTAYGYDLAGRLTSVTNAAGTGQQAVTQYFYDAEGRMTELRDALGRRTLFEYDAAGRRTKRTLPLGVGVPFSFPISEHFHYDAVGNLTNHVSFNGRQTRILYDTENQVTARIYFDGSSNTFAYNPVGLRTNLTDASGITRYAYDALDRLTNKATPQGTLTYTYDALDRVAVTASSTPNGTSVTNRWGVTGLLTNVVDRFGNTNRYVYDLAGNLRTNRLANGVTNIFTYDTRHRLTNLLASAGTNLAGYAYQLAVTGHRTNVVEANGRTTRYAYDPLYRLTTETVTNAPAGPNGTVTYTNDLVGNRLHRVSALTGVTTTTNTYDDNDRISGEAFDDSGNVLTNASGHVYAWDGENRLTNATLGATTLRLVYDGDGNRVRRSVITGGVTNTTLYLVDDLNPTGYAQVLEELTATNATPIRLYTYGNDLISQRASDGTTHWFGHDGHGTVRYLANTSGGITDRYDYDAFGVPIYTNGTTTNLHRYAGEQFDPDLGLYYLRARYLNPGQGRFVSRDPFEGFEQFPATLHAYNYAQRDPVNRIDPSGLSDSTISGLLATVTTVGSFSVNVVSRVNAPAVGQRLTFVYRSVQNGVVRYVGITFDLSRRSAEHLREVLRIDINDVVAALTSRLDAKAVEQTLIELHVLGRNGGALLNRINSIAQTNPDYAESLRRGTEILRMLGYPGL